MVTDQELKAIVASLEEALATTDPRQWLMAAGLNTVEFLTPLGNAVGLSGNPYEFARHAVELCVQREWQDEPPWLQRLLEALDAQPGVTKISDMGTILQNISAKMDPRLDIRMAEWVQDNLPFVDRTVFRDGVATLCRTDGRPVMVIDGPGKSGKSYSSELLDYIYHKAGSLFRVARVKLEPGTESAMTPEILAQLLVQRIADQSNATALPLVDPGHRNLELHAGWVLQNAKKTGARWWIVLDQFALLPRGDDTREFIQVLARLIANEEVYRRHVRLVLVDCGFRHGLDPPLHQRERLESVHRAKIFPEEIATSITRNDVRKCFERVFDQIGVTPDPGELDTLTEGVMLALPEGEDRLIELNDRMYLIGDKIRSKKAAKVGP